MFDKKIYDKQYYQKHKKHLDKLSKQWAKKHPKRIKEINKKYYRKNSKQEKIRTLNWRYKNYNKYIKAWRKWYSKNKARLLTYSKKYYKLNLQYIQTKQKIKRQKLQILYNKEPWRRTLASIKARCACKYSYYKQHSIKNYLTLKDLKYLWIRDKAYLMQQPSIDRINSYKNYTITNCRYLELKINQQRPKRRKDGN